MGKTTGFLEYQRQANPSVEPLERVRGFDEFHPPLCDDRRREQSGRCMDCGVPFCQSGVNLGGMVTGCPLHNLIPEWNDMIWHGNLSHALARLVKTNPFPEFTGRVCPALCEAACTCGLHDAPVTVRDNELYIIESAYEAGLIQPRPPKARTGRRVAVVGSGPSGLAAAEALNRRGHSATVFEKDDRAGGLLMYGIPNMKLDKRVVERRLNLLREEGVEFVTGFDAAQGENARALLDGYDAVLLCCGAGQPRDLTAPGRESAGIHFAVDYLRANTRALLETGGCAASPISAKDCAVLVVGGGDTGNDCLGTAIRQGAKSVVQLEMMPKPPETRADNNPWPQYPRVLKTDYGQEEAAALFGADPRRYQSTVKAFLSDEGGRVRAVETILLRPERDETTGRTRMTPVEGSEETLEADLVLIAAGFVGCRAETAQAFGVELNARGCVATKPDGHATNVNGVFAAGDMRRGQSLVVWAIAEGRSAARAVDEYLMGYSNL